MFASEKEYRLALSRIKKLAAKSHLASEYPATAEGFAERLVKQMDDYGQRGRDSFAVKNLIKDFADKIDVEIELKNEEIRFRSKKTRSRRSR